MGHIYKEVLVHANPDGVWAAVRDVGAVHLRLARGFYGSDGEPRYKKGGCTLPIDRAVIAQLSDALKAWDISQAEGLKTANASQPAPAKKAAKKKAAADEDEE